MKKKLTSTSPILHVTHKNGHEFTSLLRLWDVTASDFIFEPSLPKNEKNWGVQSSWYPGLM